MLLCLLRQQIFFYLFIYGYYLISQLQNFNFQPNNNFKINIYIENENEPENTNREDWQIVAHQTIEIENIFSPIYLPYIKLSLLEEHPLLWKFKYDILDCELSGKLENHFEFTSKLHWLYEKETGGFIKRKNDFYELQNLINGKKKKN